MIRGKPLTEGKVTPPPPKRLKLLQHLFQRRWMEVYACAGGPGRILVSGLE